MLDRLEYLDKDSTFAQKIETDGNICNSCYRKIRDFYSPLDALPDFVTDQVEYEEDVNFSYFDDYVDSGRPSDKQPYCPCGAVEWTEVKIRPLDEDEMIEVGQRISDRLDEKGVDHDKDVFFDVIREEGPKPENQFSEESVFEEATERAVSAVKE